MTWLLTALPHCLPLTRRWECLASTCVECLARCHRYWGLDNAADASGRGLSCAGLLRPSAFCWDGRPAWLPITGVACSSQLLHGSPQAASQHSLGGTGVGRQGNLLHPARGCQSPCPPLRRGFPALHQLYRHSLPLQGQDRKWGNARTN